MTDRLRAAVFASGGGTNLQALLDHVAARPDSPWSVTLVLSDRLSAGALARAEQAGVSTEVVEARGRDDDDVAREMLSVLDRYGIDLVILAGYLRLIPPDVVRRFAGRMLNIHPALLPSFGGKGMYGMNVHRTVIEAGVRITGPTVHMVDEEYDRGRIVAQWPVPVKSGDTPEELARRVLEVEHQLYPRAVDHVSEEILAGSEPGPLDVEGDAFVSDVSPLRKKYSHAIEE